MRCGPSKVVEAEGYGVAVAPGSHVGRLRPARAAVALLGLLAAGTLQAADTFCGGVPAAGFDQPPNHAHSGLYDNATYRYAVAIPRGWTAYSSAVGPERGLGIVLSWTPRAFLSVDAVYDVFYDVTAAGVHRRDVNAIRLHDQLLGDVASPTALAHTAGGRFQSQVQCNADPQTYIHEDVLVVRNREIYRLHLQTVPERYAADVKLLDAMVRSWQWRGMR